MTIFVELLDRSINVDEMLSTIDLPPVIVPLVSLEIPTLERLRSPASRCFENRLEHSIRLCPETSAWNRHYVWMVAALEGILDWSLPRHRIAEQYVERFNLIDFDSNVAHRMKPGNALPFYFFTCLFFTCLLLRKKRIDR
ncbi:MAG: hypothetical protein NTZ04_08420 [Chloroflexi bacterium]|nr:hypothetical protein [Chloroflexota bacterium]